MLYGRGAGQMPSASAVVSDVINAAHASHMRYMTFRNTYEMSDEIEIEKDWVCKYLIRITAKDQPGVLAKVCNIFGANAVSLNSIIQKKSDGQSASVVFVTHKACENAVKAALENIAALDEILSVDNMLRVEESV
ncbi:Homoserine dehydrogenase [bioreactor metagenome]|uniref:Homoserine dehydrogenase n=1 Tax=bioreactor metagenome TaxID=1076179 RepID=A0A645BJ87_9ZZZZ